MKESYFDCSNYPDFCKECYFGDKIISRVFRCLLVDFADNLYEKIKRGDAL